MEGVGTIHGQKGLHRPPRLGSCRVMGVTSAQSHIAQARRRLYQFPTSLHDLQRCRRGVDTPIVQGQLVHGSGRSALFRPQKGLTPTQPEGLEHDRQETAHPAAPPNAVVAETTYRGPPNNEFGSEHGARTSPAVPNCRTEIQAAGAHLRDARLESRHASRSARRSSPQPRNPPTSDVAASHELH